MSLRRIQSSLFLLSAVLIAYQILLIKLFSIQYWYHFAYLIISIALLGFGASGTFIVLFRRHLRDRLDTILFIVPLLIAASLWGSLYAIRFIDFNPLMILWQKQEIMRLLGVSLAVFIPFFLGALCIGLSLSTKIHQVHALYFANLIGSGLGSLIMLLTLFHIGPYDILMVLSLMAVGASVVAGQGRLKKGAAVTLGMVIVLLHIASWHHQSLEISPFKDLPQAMAMSGAQKEFERFGPLGLVTVLDSPAYHYLPDLSLICPYPLPGQKGLFLDGHTVGAIHEFKGDPQELRFLDWRTASVAYSLLEQPDVLIIGGGSGTEILNAAYHGGKSITVVEMNRDIVELLQGPYRQYSGAVYDDPRTRLFIEEGRGFLQSTPERYDLIQISLLESMGSASAGVYALNENYLFTTESLMTALDRLKPGGLLSISRWIRNPPHDSVKLIAMAIEAVEALGKYRADQSIILIRSWQTATLLVKKGPWRSQEIIAVKTFCGTRLFDIAYAPGVTEEETNLFNRMEPDVLYQAVTKLFSPRREELYRQYPFYLRPATDDRPFFNHFFRLEFLKQYTAAFERNLIPLMDWGYILVWMTALILGICGMAAILAPLPLIGTVRKGLVPVFIYFGALGLAYMCLEISLLQQFIRYLYDPVFSASVVIGSFLFYSGIGSLLAGKFPRITAGQIFIPVGIIAVMGLMLILSDTALQSLLSPLPLGLRMALCSLLIAPLAMAMGIPFPSGLELLPGRRQSLIPWAWGINGFFSVIGGSATVLMAMSWGFKIVVLFAVGLYILAAIIFLWLKKVEALSDTSSDLT